MTQMTNLDRVLHGFATIDEAGHVSDMARDNSIKLPCLACGRMFTSVVLNDHYSRPCK